jgi:cytidylate kinase
MNHESSSTHSPVSSLSQLVQEVRRHWGMRRQPGAVQRDISSQASRPFTVALSREVGTQGTSIASEVGRLLGWHVYDHELLEHIAKEMGLRTALLESVDENVQSWLRESIGASLASPASGGEAPWASESAYIHHLVETVLVLGVHGECLIVGRGAAFILPPETTLRGRLVGPVRERIATLSRTLGISPREAAREVRTVDRQRTDFVQDHFFKDPTDPRNYDIVLNASRLSIGQSAELIIEALHRLQARRTRE